MHGRCPAAVPRCATTAVALAPSWVALTSAAAAVAVERFVNTRMGQTLEDLRVKYELYKEENFALRTKVRMKTAGGAKTKP